MGLERETIRINVIQHKSTGLLAAVSPDLKGFIVHARTDEELYGKLGAAFEEFMGATGRTVSNVSVREETPEGFWPPCYVASGTLSRAA